ncbi:MAG: hypothetical protein ACHQET_11580 [Chitinophagales bacterium]
MRKIKRISHLEAEKLKLRVTELELEKTLKKDWTEVKERLSPKSLFAESVQNVKNKHWLESGIHAAASFVGSKILEKLDEKMGKRESKDHSGNYSNQSHGKSGAENFHHETH